MGRACLWIGDGRFARFDILEVGEDGRLASAVERAHEQLADWHALDRDRNATGPAQGDARRRVIAMGTSPYVGVHTRLYSIGLATGRK